MATQAQYDAAAKALLALEHAIVVEKNVPTFFLPSQEVLAAYAVRAAKVAVDAALAAGSAP